MTGSNKCLSSPSPMYPAPLYIGISTSVQTCTNATLCIGVNESMSNVSVNKTPDLYLCIVQSSVMT